MHLDFALPVDGDLEAGIVKHDQRAELAVMDYSYHVPITEWTDKVQFVKPTLKHMQHALANSPGTQLGTVM